MPGPHICNSTLERSAVSNVTYSGRGPFNGHTFHEQSIVIGLCIVVLAMISSLALMVSHCGWSRNKEQRRFILRVLFIIPLYSALSWAMLVFYQHATIIEVARDAYEAYALANFYWLLLSFCGRDLDTQAEFLEDQMTLRWSAPLNWCQHSCRRCRDRKHKPGQHQPWRMQRPAITTRIHHSCSRTCWSLLSCVKIREKADMPSKLIKLRKPTRADYELIGEVSPPMSKPHSLLWLKIIHFSIIQYCVVRIACTIAAGLAQTKNMYCKDSLQLYFAHFYIVVLEFTSITVAMYCLIELYSELKLKLKLKSKPKPKDGDEDKSSRQQEPMYNNEQKDEIMKGLLARTEPPSEHLFHGHKLLAKVLVIKGVIFFSFWQSTAISWAIEHDYLRPDARMAYNDLAVGLNVILICTELLILSVIVWWIFSFRELGPSERLTHAQDPEGEANTASANEPHGFRNRTRRICHATVECISPGDLFRGMWECVRSLYKILRSIMICCKYHDKGKRVEIQAEMSRKERDVRQRRVEKTQQRSGSYSVRARSIFSGGQPSTADDERRPGTQPVVASRSDNPLQQVLGLEHRAPADTLPPTAPDTAHVLDRPVNL